MRYVSIALLALVVGSVLGQGQQSETKTIRASEIILTSPDGTRMITLVAKNDMAGMWLASKNSKRQIALFDAADQCGLGVYDDTRLTCLSVDPVSGDGFLQLYKNGKVSHIDADAKVSDKRPLITAPRK